MEQYIFILGRNPALSVLELESYLKARSIKYKILDQDDIAIVLELPSIKASKMMKELGGIQKIGKIITSFDGLYKGKENKLRYGISNYTKDEDIKIELKSYFKDQGLKATIKKSQQQKLFLTPSEAFGVLEVIQYNGSIAKTIAVFNPKDQKERDEGRPSKSKFHKISLKLAKILVNLSSAKSGDTLVVPFSDLGTIVQEAIINGVDATGVEIDYSLLKASQENLTWIRKKYNPKGRYKILKGKVKDCSRLVKRVDYAIAVPPMGPMMRSFPTDSEARKILRNLQPKYEETIKSLSKVAKKGIVLVVPKFRTKSKKELTLPMEKLLSTTTLKWVEPIQYSSPTSRIILEIWILKK